MILSKYEWRGNRAEQDQTDPLPKTYTENQQKGTTKKKKNTQEESKSQENGDEPTKSNQGDKKKTPANRRGRGRGVNRAAGHLRKMNKGMMG